jgi:N utilization substance protein B
MPKRSPRREARRRAFQVLYGFEFIPPHEAPTDAQGVAKALSMSPKQEPDDPDEGYALALAYGAWQQRAELDAIISGHSKNWKLARVAKVELAILRLGLYEILHESSVPRAVAINEAVELAKAYGDDNSPGFVNGVLDAVAKTQPAKAKTPQTDK